jgi:hypothetical protein
MRSNDSGPIGRSSQATAVGQERPLSGSPSCQSLLATRTASDSLVENAIAPDEVDKAQ